MNERMVVTGLGAISSLGDDVARLTEALKAARSGIAPLARFVPRALSPLPVAEVARIPPGEPLPVTHRLACAAGREALQDAALPSKFGRDRLAVVLGTTTGGIGHSETWYLQRLAGTRAPPELLVHHPAATVGHAVAEAVQASGPCLTLSTACSSGAHALLLGADILRSGQADVVLAGGADSICLLPFLGFNSLRLLAESPCRPFDEARSGLNLGEAGAFVVLEREGHARQRGARVHAHLRGAATTCDAYHMTAPAPDGESVVRAMGLAIERAGFEPRDIAYVNAHGTATVANDVAEARALSTVFGSRPVPVSSTKSQLGHTLGAAGAIEAVVSVLAVRDGFLPPTITTTQPFEGAPEGLVLGVSRPADVPVAMSSSFAFGGTNTVLVFARADR